MTSKKTLSKKQLLISDLLIIPLGITICYLIFIVVSWCNQTTDIYFTPYQVVKVMQHNKEELMIVEKTSSNRLIKGEKIVFFEKNTNSEILRAGVYIDVNTVEYNKKQIKVNDELIVGVVNNKTFIKNMVSIEGLIVGVVMPLIAIGIYQMNILCQMIKEHRVAVKYRKHLTKKFMRKTLAKYCYEIINEHQNNHENK